VRLSNALPLLALLGAAPAAAASEDFHVWGAATATIAASDSTVIWLEAQTRFYDDAGRLGQLLLRPGIGYKLDANTTVFLGYAYVRTDQLATPHTNEHRIWQQLSFRLAGDGQGATVVGRSRLEQRFMSGSGDMGLRFRQQLRLTAPLAGKARAVGWAEAFVALDDTGWGQRSGFDRLRSFAGITVPLGPSLALEPGYMNEYIRLPNQDRMNHIASLTVSAVF
jgi:hypothetical protein